MLLFRIILYLFLTLAVGIYSTRKVKTSRDFMLAGGLWVVAITDSIQMILIAVIWYIFPEWKMNHSLSELPAGYLNILPDPGFNSWIVWISALLTLGLGSIPQQDVFQRIMASKSENVAV